MEDLLTEALKLSKGSQAQRIILRSFTGKANHIASLVWAWTPFLDEQWAAAEARSRSNAGRELVWVKQIAGPLKWLILS